MAKRNERIARKYKHFTERDGLIVQAVFFARYLMNRQIGRLFFRSADSSACRTRTRILFDKGYLRKRFAFPNQPDVFYLGLQGRRYIAKALNYPQEEVDKIAGVEGEGDASSLAMNHELAVADLYVNAALECRQHGWTLEWQNARMLELKRLGVQPDACLRIPEVGRQAFIELTIALPTKEEMGRKLAGYKEVLEAYGGVPILWFAPTEAKLGQLQRLAEGWIYRDWILFGLLAGTEGFLTRKMWRWSESATPVRFIAVPEGGEDDEGTPDPAL